MKLPRDQLVELACMFEERYSPSPIKRGFRRSNIPPEITELIDKGLVEIRGDHSQDPCTCGITEKGISVLNMHSTLDCVLALLDAGCPVTAAFFVGRLPMEHLCSFLTHELSVVCDSAKVRFEGLTCNMEVLRDLADRGYWAVLGTLLDQYSNIFPEQLCEFLVHEYGGVRMVARIKFEELVDDAVAKDV